MRGVNKVILVGSLGADPLSKQFQNGVKYAQFAIATTEKWQDKNNTWHEHTEWQRIVAYNRLSEIACQYLKKGAKVYIEGALHTRSWTDQNSQTHYTTEIRAHALQMLSGLPQANPY